MSYKRNKKVYFFIADGVLVGDDLILLYVSLSQKNQSDSS